MPSKSRSTVQDNNMQVLGGPNTRARAACFPTALSTLTGLKRRDRKHVHSFFVKKGVPG